MCDKITHDFLIFFNEATTSKTLRHRQSSLISRRSANRSLSERNASCEPYSHDSGRISVESGWADRPAGSCHWSKHSLRAHARAVPCFLIGQNTRLSNCRASSRQLRCESRRQALIPSRPSFLRSPLQTMLSIFCAALNHSSTAKRKALD